MAFCLALKGAARFEPKHGNTMETVRRTVSNSALPRSGSRTNALGARLRTRCQRYPVGKLGRRNGESPRALAMIVGERLARQTQFQSPVARQESDGCCRCAGAWRQRELRRSGNTRQV